MGKPELMMKGENREEDCSLVIQIRHVNSPDKKCFSLNYAEGVR